MRSRHEHAIESSRRGNGREHFLAGGRKNSDGTPERVILRVLRVAQGVFVAGAVVLLAATMTDGRVLPSAGAMLRTIMVVAAVAAASSLVALKVLSARQLRDLPCAPDPPLATTSAITAVDPVLQMVLRSTDVRAALADLLAHDDGTHAPLPELLRRIGLASWEDTPAASATKLARSGRYWLSLRDDDLTPEKYDRLVTLEAVLNLYADLRPDGASRDGGQALDHRLHDVLASTAELMPLPRVGQDQADASVPVGGGEWEARRRFADFAEGVPTAFRVQFDMQANLAAGTFLVELDVPRPACFSLVSPDDAGRVRAARAYALRSALLAARGAFEADGGISTVVVNCHEHRSKETILSLGVLLCSKPVGRHSSRSPSAHARNTRARSTRLPVAAPAGSYNSYVGAAEAVLGASSRSPLLCPPARTLAAPTPTSSARVASSQLHRPCATGAVAPCTVRVAGAIPLGSQGRSLGSRSNSERRSSTG